VRLKFTGAGTDIPVDIAADRAKHDPMHTKANPGLRDEFSKFIHASVKAAVPGIPEYGEDWTRCVFAGQMLDRYLMQEAAFKFLGAWSRTQGGYMVPHGESSPPPLPRCYPEIIVSSRQVRGDQVQKRVRLRCPQYQEFQHKRHRQMVLSRHAREGAQSPGVVGE
jgi:hypothetical protein